MRKVLQVPVYLEVMPADEYWCSSLETLIDFPLLLNVSHINIWHHGDRNIVQDTCLNLLNSFAVETIHSSHNRGNADTHDLIPDNIWFKDYIEIWSDRYLVTYESQPVKYAAYERLDKCRKGMATLYWCICNKLLNQWLLIHLDLSTLFLG